MNEVLELCLELKSDMQGIAKSLAKLTKQQALSMSERWTRKEEVMQILGISARTFDRLIHDKKLPCTRINGLIFIKTSDIETLLNDNYKR